MFFASFLPDCYDRLVTWDTVFRQTTFVVGSTTLQSKSLIQFYKLLYLNVCLKIGRTRQHHLPEYIHHKKLQH